MTSSLLILEEIHFNLFSNSREVYKMSRFFRNYNSDNSWFLFFNAIPYLQQWNDHENLPDQWELRLLNFRRMLLKWFEIISNIWHIRGDMFSLHAPGKVLTEKKSTLLNPGRHHCHRNIKINLLRNFAGKMREQKATVWAKVVLVN